ncbi:MAG: efflux RND transporter periplasmic adaptor subunit, partial [Gaiellales bacterium]
EFGIVVVAAGPGTIERFVSLPGEVRPNADRLAHIVPRYSGIVTDVRAHIGDTVKEHQVLALIESDESLAPYELRTLIPGTIIAKHITLGEAVSRDVDTYVIADLGTVWVDLTVYQRDVARVRVGQQVLITSGHGLPTVSGTIGYVTPVVDETTRTATARVVLPNRDGAWRPGMFITARVLIGEDRVAVAVPRAAIHTFEDRTVVFLETPGGFTPEPVRLGRAGETHVEVLSGLEPGERYVSQGGFTLKAELGKAAFGEGHGH